MNTAFFIFIYFICSCVFIVVLSAVSGPKASYNPSAEAHS